MVELRLPADKIISLEECALCKEGNGKIGEIGKRGSVIFKTGENPLIDWYITLQKSNISDPEIGFTEMIIPIGHLTAFSQVYSSRDLAHMFGECFAIANYAIQVVRKEEWKGQLEGFMPTVVSYGKCASNINTQEHFHIKAYTLDGKVAQPFPSDTEWMKKEVFQNTDGTEYVKSGPVVKGQLSDERYAHLVKRLTEICNNC